MKAKTIRAILKKKVNELADSITDPEVAELVRKNSIVTGGSIASMLLKEPVNDYDIYFTNFETTHRVAKYYARVFNENARIKFGDGFIPVGIETTVPGEIEENVRVRLMIKSAGVANSDGAEAYEYFETNPDPDAAVEYVEEVFDEVKKERPPYFPIFLSENAITLSNKVQLVLRFFGSAEEIHKNYDFTHCTNYWESKNGILTLHPEALECLLARELRYQGSLYPLCSIIRLRKFIKRGWTINAGQILKMCVQISDLDLDDIAVLQDQLTGVDVAYFIELIEQLKERGNPVDRGYLLTIIDRMF